MTVLAIIAVALAAWGWWPVLCDLLDGIVPDGLTIDCDPEDR